MMIRLILISILLAISSNSYAYTVSTDKANGITYKRKRGQIYLKGQFIDIANYKTLC